MESYGPPEDIGDSDDESRGGSANNSKDERYPKKHTLTSLDPTDLKLIDLMMSGKTPRESAKILDKPLSTIQRRARLLVQNEALRPTFELGYSKLGIKKGFLHIYLDDGNVSEIASKLLARDGILSVGVHIGNSDIIGSFIFKDSRDILNLLEWTKHQAGVERVVCSEEVYEKKGIPKLEKIMSNNGEGAMTRMSN